MVPIPEIIDDGWRVYLSRQARKRQLDRSTEAPVRAGLDGPSTPQTLLNMSWGCTVSLPQACAQSAPEALQAPLQDPGRDKEAPDRLNENGH